MVKTRSATSSSGKWQQKKQTILIPTPIPVSKHLQSRIVQYLRRLEASGTLNPKALGDKRTQGSAPRIMNLGPRWILVLEHESPLLCIY